MTDDQPTGDPTTADSVAADPDAANPSVTPEDRRQHLAFIQSIITRMSAASISTKSWLMPVIVGTYGYALTKGADSVAVLGVGAVLLFAYLDANYLRQEQHFRRLYKAVAEGSTNIASFSLKPEDVPQASTEKYSENWGKWMPRWINRLLPGPSVWISWAVAPFYLVLVSVGLFIACWVG